MDSDLITDYKRLFSSKEKKAFAKQFKISPEQANSIIKSGFIKHEFHVFIEQKILERLKNLKENEKLLSNL